MKCLVVLPVLVLAVGLPGCVKKSARTTDPQSQASGGAAAPAEGERNPLKPRPDDQMAQSDVRRGAQKRLVEGMMRNIGQLYATYVTEFNRPPATVEDFKNYIKRDARQEFQALEAGTIIFVPNVQPSSRTVLAYEKDKYEKWNNRVVVFADGHVETLEEAQFRAALKASGK